MQYKSEEEKQQVVLYNLQRADKTLKEAILLADNQFWNGCANRLYYAAYYSTTALLIKNNQYSKTHAGTRNLFNQHFIKTSILTSKESYLYAQLFDKRQDGDYATFVEYKKEDIFPMIEPTKEFIETSKNLINEKS